MADRMNFQDDYTTEYFEQEYNQTDMDMEDPTDEGGETPMLDEPNNAEQSVENAGFDISSAGAEPIENPNIPADTNDGDDIAKLDFSSQYTDPTGVGTRTFAGTDGANTFQAEALLNAKPEIIAEYTNDDGSVDWRGVTGENDNYHDHWVEGPGDIVINDFGKGDKFVLRGHTAEAILVEESEGVATVGLISDQGRDNSRGDGAHDLDVIGKATIYHDGSFNFGSDVRDISNNVFDGVAIEDPTDEGEDSTADESDNQTDMDLENMDMENMYMENMYMEDPTDEGEDSTADESDNQTDMDMENPTDEGEDSTADESDNQTDMDLEMEMEMKMDMDMEDPTDQGEDYTVDEPNNQTDMDMENPTDQGGDYTVDEPNNQTDMDMEDTTDEGGETPMLDEPNNAEQSAENGDFDISSTGAEPIENPNIPADTNDGDDIAKLDFSSQYTDPNGVGTRTFAGTDGANTFQAEALLNAKPEIIAEYTNNDGSVNWRGVAGENDNYHDHWIEGPGDIVINNFSDGDKFVLRGHTAEAILIDELEGVATIGLISDQGRDNSRGDGAHDLDVIGKATIYHDGSFNFGSDVRDISNVFDGVI